jgi:pyruvate/2-oxoglutarate dehydrogenase complex dihydrolipoamide dehydrogenase (E3) component
MPPQDATVGRVRDAGAYDLVIVGAGSAGLTAAQFAATMGQRVALVDRERLGGDCLWTGCVPSKALLAAARAAHGMRHADTFGLQAVEPDVDLAAVWRRIRAVQDEIARTDDAPERLRAEGIAVRFGTARLLAGDRVQVEGHGVLTTKRILLTTGSRPATPSIPGLAEAAPLSTETLWDLPQPPASLVVVGGGPIAMELAQALTRLGVTVTVLEQEPTVLARDEPSLVAPLVARLRAEGVVLHTGAQVTSVQVAGPADPVAERVTVHAQVDGRPLAVRAAAVLVATGRTPNVEGLGLEAVGVDMDERGIVVDDGYRTSVGTIWAAGDVAGRHLFTHAAAFEASRAVRNMLFPGTDTGAFTVPWCTFTEPELAHAGLTDAQARAEHGDRAVRVWRHELRASDRARADGATDGAVLLVTAKGRLVGGHVLAPAAGEVVHELALAIHQGLRLADLASVVHVYPTIALAIQQLAAQAAYGRARRLRWLIR